MGLIYDQNIHHDTLKIFTSISSKKAVLLGLHFEKKTTIVCVILERRFP